MLPPGGSICGKSTLDSPLGCPQGGSLGQTSIADVNRASSASCTGGAPGDGASVMSFVQSTNTAPARHAWIQLAAAADGTSPREDGINWARENPPNVKRLRCGLVFKAHRLLYHSTSGLRVIKEKEKMPPRDGTHRGCGP